MNNKIKTPKWITRLIEGSIIVTMLTGTAFAICTAYEIVNDGSVILSMSMMLAFYILTFLNAFALITSK